MTQYAKADTERSSRGPYMGMAVFFLLLIVIGILFLVPKLRHRDMASDEESETDDNA